MLRLYYRISDESYAKTKIPGSNKKTCFMNFCKAFADIIFPSTDLQAGLIFSEETPMKIIADNCKRSTIKMLMETGIPITITNVGNSGSLRKAFEIALEEGQDEDTAYFCEDDYLHLGIAPYVLKEGVSISDYVTLYDHPDKYTKLYKGGEFSKVMRTKSSHWRFTQSTCMTFGCKVGTLRRDKSVWDEWTKDEHPHDHKVFTELSERGRKLALSIPGVACHTDLTFSGAVNHVMIDTWAIELMIAEFEELFRCHWDANFKEFEIYKQMVVNKTGWQRLVALDALWCEISKKGEPN